MSTLLALLKKPGVRYLITGGFVWLLELGVIYAAQQAGLSPVPAVAVGYSVGTLVGFVVQKFITFGDTRTHHKVVGAQLLATIGLVIFNLLFTMLLTQILQSMLPTVVIRTLAIVITTLWNFYLYRTAIFKGAPEQIG